MIRGLPSPRSTDVVATLNKPQYRPKSSEAIFSHGDITMYKTLSAVLLISTRVWFAYGYNTSPSSYLLLNTDHLAAQRLNWQTPLSTKDDRSTVLNVRRMFGCNENTLMCYPV
jgi:hypothetical protein